MSRLQLAGHVSNGFRGLSELTTRSSIPPRSTTRTERASWTKALQQACRTAHDAILHVLEGDWLKLDISIEEGDLDSERRLAQLAQIRKLFVPDLVLRLHNMFFDTRSVLPENLALALQLPNLVADESNKLFLEFVWPKENKLQAYLLRVREAALAQLDDPEARGDVFGAIAR